MTARHSNPKSKKEREKFFFFIHLFSFMCGRRECCRWKNSLIGTLVNAHQVEKSLIFKNTKVVVPSSENFLISFPSDFFIAGGRSLKRIEKEPRPKTTSFGAYQRNKRWRRRKKRRKWWSCVIEPRDEFDGDGSIQSLNKKMAAKKGRKEKKIKAG